MQKAVGDGTSGEAADLMFHLAIARSAQNEMLFDLLNNISDVIQETMKETRRVYLFDKEKALRRLYEEHQKIYQAIEQQDSDKAVQQMKSHLAEVRDTILENIRQK